MLTEDIDWLMPFSTRTVMFSLQIVGYGNRKDIGTKSFNPKF